MTRKSYPVRRGLSSELSKGRKEGRPWVSPSVTLLRSRLFRCLDTPSGVLLPGPGVPVSVLRRLLSIPDCPTPPEWTPLFSPGIHRIWTQMSVKRERVYSSPDSQGGVITTSSSIHPYTSTSVVADSGRTSRSSSTQCRVLGRGSTGTPMPPWCRYGSNIPGSGLKNYETKNREVIRKGTYRDLVKRNWCFRPEVPGTGVHRVN